MLGLAVVLLAAVVRVARPPRQTTRASRAAFARGGYRPLILQLHAHHSLRERQHRLGSTIGSAGHAPIGVGRFEAGLWLRAGSDAGGRGASVDDARNDVRDAEVLFRAPREADGAWPLPTQKELAALAREIPALTAVSAFGIRRVDFDFDKPAHIQDLIDAWPARSWDREEFLRRFGDMEVRLRPCATLHEYGFPGPSSKKVQMREYFSRPAPCASEVIFENDFQPLHQMLRGNCEVPALLQKVHAAPVFSGGRAHTGVNFHRHNEAWLAQLQGRKVWFLLPPNSQRPDPLPPWWYLEKRPPGLFVCTLSPGEVLFLPSNWWHATWNLDDFSVAVGWEGGASKTWENDMHAIADGDLERLDAAGVPSHRMVAFAARTGHADVMRLLIEEDADLVLRADSAPAAIAAARGGHVNVLELLRDYRGILRADSGGKTALHAAANSGQHDAAAWLIRQRAEVRLRDSEGFEPLHLAAANGHADVIGLLLQHGGIASAADAQSSTPLSSAAFNGHAAVVQMLLQAGASVASIDRLQMSPLHLASLRGHTAVAETLLFQDADITAKDHLGRTPLHLAAYGYGDSDDRSSGIRTAIDANMAVTRTLLASGADPSTQDRKGLVAAQYAATLSHFGVAQLLEDARRAPPSSQSSPVPQQSFVEVESIPEVSRMVSSQEGEDKQASGNVPSDQESLWTWALATLKDADNQA